MWAVLIIGTIVLITFYTCIFKHKSSFVHTNTGVVYEVLEVYSVNGYTVYKLQSTKDGKITYIDMGDLHRDYSEI